VACPKGVNAFLRRAPAGAPALRVLNSHRRWHIVGLEKEVKDAALSGSGSSDWGSKFQLRISVPPLAEFVSAAGPLGGVMNSQLRYTPMHYFDVPFAVTVAILVVACSAPTPRPTGDAATYQDAKGMFRKGRFDRTLEFTEGLAEQKPPKEFTQRAQVLRSITYAGLMQGYKDLAEGYGKGSEATKNPHFQIEYKRIRNDALHAGGQAALGLGEVAHSLTEGGQIAKEVTLDAAYPASEGPLEVAELIKVRTGAWIEPDQQEAAAKAAQLKGVDEVLGAVVEGDRSKARNAMNAGPVKIEGADFAIFLGRQLVDAAGFFDRKHLGDYQKLKLLCGVADDSATAALALLKDKPDKDKEKAAKKIQDQVKAVVKAT
jgi:hypothetical protein